MDTFKRVAKEVLIWIVKVLYKFLELIKKVLTWTGKLFRNVYNFLRRSEMKNNVKFTILLLVIFTGPEVILGGIYYFSKEEAYFWILGKVLFLLLGIVLAVQFLILVFLLASPYIAGAFVSTVEDPKRNLFWPLFVAVENGRAKAIMDQGGNAIRYVINKHDAGFPVPPPENDDAKWEVEVGGARYSNARNFWEKRIEKKTGLSFVGIYPWRRVYHSQITPVKMLTKDSTRKLFIAEKPETTDHVRVREFNWGAEVTVLLKDRYRISILFSFRLMCTNPHKLLFAVDNWDESFGDAIASRTIEILQERTLDQLTNMGGTGKSWIAEQVNLISNVVEPKTEENWGLKLLETQIAKYEFKGLSDEEKKALTIVEVTKRKMEAKAIEYKTEKKGEADVVRDRAKVIEKYGVAGMQASRDQMLETAAKDGQQTMITGLGNSQPPEEGESVKLLKALLAKTK